MYDVSLIHSYNPWLMSAFIKFWMVLKKAILGNILNKILAMEKTYGEFLIH